MAKGEGGEQYSNASLLNKQPSSDDIKLAKKVGSFILFCGRLFSCVMVLAEADRKGGFQLGVWMNGHTGRQIDNLNWARVAQWESSISKPV